MTTRSAPLQQRAAGLAPRAHEDPPDHRGAAPGAAAGPANKVLITTPVPDQKTAWTKARMDVLQILREDGYVVAEMPASWHVGEWIGFMRGLLAQLQVGGHVVIEYPFDQRKRAYLLRAFRQLRGVRIYALIHDLDSLRHADSPPARELAILKLFDGLISHNAVMSDWLRTAGYEGPISGLGLFDYRTQSEDAWHESGLRMPVKVLCAGNLSYPKARFIYDERLGQLEGVELSLYGAFFEPERMPPSAVRYKGAFDPDHPQLDGKYHFGLIWDGTTVESCSGNYGRYLRFNNPHKLSLYMSMGLPVIVWKEAAIARFVLFHGIGIAVADLRDIASATRDISGDEYAEMTRRVVAIGRLVKRGHFLRQALGRLTDDAPATAAIAA